MDLDRYRQDSRASWDSISANWEAHREFLSRSTAPVAERLIERLDPQPGQTILELAAGLGETGLADRKRHV